MRKSASERFWRFVQETETCWSWTGATDKDGYGVFDPGEGPKTVRAHRFSYELFVGPVEKKLVLHKCDTPACVRPDHLFLGTWLDNMEDKCRKGRHVSGTKGRPDLVVRGIDHGNAKLTEEGVLDIRQNYVPRKVPLSFFAKKYDVSMSLVSQVVSGSIWGHV